MKTSEVIRKAINNHLTSEKLNRSDHFEQMAQHKLPYLCWAIVFAHCGDCVNISAGLTINESLLPDKLKEVVAFIKTETNFFREFDSDGDATIYAEMQQLRYMYADFLAYYFEDQGD